MLEKNKAYASEVSAYQSALYGFKIGISGWKAPVLGPKSQSAAEKAIELDSTNPNGYIQYGNIQYYMPSSFGGSKTEAINYYKKALKIFEKNSFTTLTNWNYLNLLTIIGMAYEALGDYKNAMIYYTKALKKEPKYILVRNNLIPELKKKIKEKK